MTSAGGLVRPDAFRAKDGLLSGPAGGVVGAALAGRRSGFARVIAFDMGGTSTDVARYDGDFEYLFEHEVGDAHLVAPALAIESVAAGGGSICALDGSALRVGPESAGACARARPATGRAGRSPSPTSTCCSGGSIPSASRSRSTPAAAERALRLLLDGSRRRRATPAREALLAGLLEIADERMADAIRGISLRRGYDPAEYALVAFGGAGAQHACAVATLLGVAQVLVPPDAGLLSALGLGAAVVERFAERQVLQPLADVGGRLAALARRARRTRPLAAVAAEGVPAARGRGPAPHRCTCASPARRRRSPSSWWARRRRRCAGPAFPRATARSTATPRRRRAIELESIRAVAAGPPEPEPHAGSAAAGRRGPPRRGRACRRAAASAAPGARCRSSTATPSCRATGFAGPALVLESPQRHRGGGGLGRPGGRRGCAGAGTLMMGRARRRRTPRA